MTNSPSASIVSYEDYENAIRQVREAVFIEEQGVSREDEFDGFDNRCLHAAAFDVAGTLVGTGRLDPEKDGKIGRVAVLASHRRQGLGRQLMQSLETEAERIGLKQVWFHAQVSAVPFYEALGYQAEGEEFLEANIRHVKMRREF